MDTLEYIKKVNKFENESRKSVKKIVVGQDAKGDEMRELTKLEIFDIMTNSSIDISESDYTRLLYAVGMCNQIRSDFAGNLFYNDGVSTKPLNVKIEELKNEVDEMAVVKK